MDLLFYHGDETEKRLVAVAYRAAESILRSFQYLLPSIGSELWALLSVDTLWGLALLAAGWFLTSVISGPLGLAVNVIFLAYGVWQIWGTIGDTYALLKDWFWGFYNAKTEAELDEAGKHFAEGLAKGGLTLIELLVTHRALKFASRKLAAKYPPPDKLRERFREEKQKAESRKEGPDAQRRAEQTEAERSRAAREATPKERKALERLQELRRTVEARGGVELGQDLSRNLPSPSAGHVVAIGVIGLAVAGLFALAAAASQEDQQPRKRRSRNKRSAR